MTPKEKAEELLLKYLKIKRHKMFNGFWHKMISKQCALIAVDEQIELLLNLSPHMAFPEQVKHLQEVKQEIEKL
jgi:hypothetical protein